MVERPPKLKVDEVLTRPFPPWYFKAWSELIPAEQVPDSDIYVNADLQSGPMVLYRRVEICMLDRTP